jgi:DNA polymerase
MLVASPGKELFCADFSAVEARLAFWIAEHEEGVKAFRDGRKLYEEMAEAAFGIPTSQIKKDSLERFVGKESVLGCQYGLGWKKFMINCHQKGMPDVTAQIAKRAVDTYRKVHYPVTAMWKALEQVIIKAIRNPGSVHHVTKVSIYVRRNFLHIKLPSGRKMRYYKPRISYKQLASGYMAPQIHHYEYRKGMWIETVSWGGVFFNHIVQGTARDLLAQAMMNLEKAGHEVLMSAHDEILSEREIGTGSLKEYISIFTKLPCWADGLPLTAEGWTGTRYRK